VTTFGLRASVVAPHFVAGGIFALPLVSVILLAFAGGLVYDLRHACVADARRVLGDDHPMVETFRENMRRARDGQME